MDKLGSVEKAKRSPGCVGEVDLEKGTDCVLTAAESLDAAPYQIPTIMSCRTLKAADHAESLDRLPGSLSLSGIRETMKKLYEVLKSCSDALGRRNGRNTAGGIQRGNGKVEAGEIRGGRGYPLVG